MSCPQSWLLNFKEYASVIFGIQRPRDDDGNEEEKAYSVDLHV